MYPSKSQKEKQKITKFWQNGDLVVRWTQLCFPTQAFLTPSPPGGNDNYEEEKNYTFSLLHHLEEMKIMWSKKYIMLYIMHFVFFPPCPHLQKMNIMRKIEMLG